MEMGCRAGLDGTATSSTMKLRSLQAIFCPCRRRKISEEAPKPSDVPAVTEDIVWNCDPTVEPEPVSVQVQTSVPLTILEQVQEQLANLPPEPPKSLQSCVDKMMEVRTRFLREAIEYSDNPTQLKISYQGAVNTLQWIFSPEGDPTWDERYDGPAYNAVIEPLDSDYYEKHVFPAWRWRERKLKPAVENKTSTPCGPSQANVY